MRKIAFRMQCIPDPIRTTKASSLLFVVPFSTFAGLFQKLVVSFMLSLRGELHSSRTFKGMLTTVLNIKKR